MKEYYHHLSNRGRPLKGFQVVLEAPMTDLYFENSHWLLCDGWAAQGGLGFGVCSGGTVAVDESWVALGGSSTGDASR